MKLLKIFTPKCLHTLDLQRYFNLIKARICDVEAWPGEITITNGRACQPQSQGLVERGNDIVEEMVAYHFNTSCSEGASLGKGQHGYLRFSASLNFSACKCDFAPSSYLLSLQTVQGMHTPTANLCLSLHVPFTGFVKEPIYFSIQSLGQTAKINTISIFSITAYKDM